MKNIHKRIEAVHVLHGRIVLVCIRRSEVWDINFVRNNKFGKLYFGCFRGALLIIAAAVFSLLKLLVQVTFTAAFHLRLIAVLAEVFSYIVLIQLIPANDSHLDHCLEGEADHDQYGYCYTHW